MRTTLVNDAALNVVSIGTRRVSRVLRHFYVVEACSYIRVLDC